MGLDKCMIPHRLPRWLGGKESSCPFRRHGSIPKSRSSPGEGNDNSLKYSCLENSVDRGAWWATIHGVRVGRDLGAEHTQHTMARIYHGYHTEYFHCPKSTLCSAYSSLSSLPYPQPPSGALTVSCLPAWSAGSDTAGPPLGCLWACRSWCPGKA